MSAVADEYRTYLERFHAQFGACGLGTYMKHKGRMIKKLALEEFEVRWYEFVEVDRTHRMTLERGDTINDVLVRLLRERSDELLLDAQII